MAAVDVKAEQIRSLYRQSVAVFLTNPINALIVTATFWSSAARSFLIGWTAAMVLVVAARLELRRRYWAAAPPADEADAWGRVSVAGAAVTGALWGFGGFVLLGQPGSLSQLLVAFVIGGMCAAAAGTLSCHLPAYFGYVVPALLSLALRAVLLRDDVHLAMAAMIVVYGLGLSFVANVSHRSLRDAFRFRFENEDLLRQLSGAREHLEETNRTLEQRVVERGEALRRQSEALRDAQRLEAVGRLAGGVAHDFNNLLTVLLANLSILLADDGRAPQAGVRDETLRSMLLDMRDAAQRGADLVRQLLVFSRRQRAAPRTLDLNQRVSAMHRLLARLIGENLELKLHLHEQPLLVRADPSQIEQVVINLVTNARDAMPDGGAVTIETGSIDEPGTSDGLPAGAYVVLSVSDTGQGMDPETRARVFDPFFTTKDVGKGTGLGLATVYGIVDQGGGHIRVDSVPQHGSCFRVYLPRAAAPSSSDSDPKTALAEDVPPATVLLVEDEVAVRSVTQRMLKAAGHEVLVAESGEQALALAELHSGSIDLLVTDVVMAKVGGPELAQRLAAVRPELKVLFISGYTQNQIPAGAGNPGIDFLHKPFTFEALHQKVSALLSPTDLVAMAPPPISRRESAGTKFAK
jgi:signal transduction histidine kinase/ActR/RegA family two-component response regulator